MSIYTKRRNTKDLSAAFPLCVAGEPRTLDPASGTHSLAFSLDLDGVFYRYDENLPGAVDAIKFLNHNKIPFTFLSNGGNMTEEAKAEELSEKFGTKVETRQVILRHTPYRALVEEHGDKNVLMVGGPGQLIRNLSLEYGFKNVYTTSDIYVSDPDNYPIAELSAAYHKENARQTVPKDIQFSAVIVWDNPKDFGLDLQIVMDVLLARSGTLNTLASLEPDKESIQPPIYWCNQGLTWRASNPIPRFAQRSFKAATEGIWAERTDGKPLRSSETVGKPFALSYDYSEQALLKAMAATGVATLDRAYSVGDNPGNDVRGPNEYKTQSKIGVQWNTILVESGVWNPKDEPEFEPDVIVPGISEAIAWALTECGHTLIPIGKPTNPDDLLIDASIAKVGYTPKPRLSFGVDLNMAVATLDLADQDPHPEDKRNAFLVSDKSGYSNSDEIVYENIARVFGKSNIPFDPSNPRSWLIQWKDSIRSPSPSAYEYIGVSTNSPSLRFNQVALDAVSEVCGVLTSNFRLNLNPTCKMVVRVGSTQGFSPETLEKFFITMFAFEAQFQKIHPGKFGPLRQRADQIETSPSVKQIVGYFGEDGFVRIRPGATEARTVVEFRGHKPTLDPEVVNNWIKLCVGLLEFADTVDKDVLLDHLKREGNHSAERDIRSILHGLGMQQLAEFYGRAL
ncbi:hypothetical protein HYFRA_00005670 [Hymenoscyphus fraxineus]|uniref:HAD-superfamily hydrolase n=1 Tax=Hymenoscyphus fraxineus TaxID=746836 RepID=A0A9N9KR15_9HELO|nr:hypothetical protein HYFRA_00005670 [Hymenoscyphus fraxineus]